MNGERMPIPKYCPIFLAELMEICWKQNPEERYNFIQICDYLQNNYENLY